MFSKLHSWQAVKIPSHSSICTLNPFKVSATANKLSKLLMGQFDPVDVAIRTDFELFICELSRDLSQVSFSFNHPQLALTSVSGLIFLNFFSFKRKK